MSQEKTTISYKMRKSHTCGSLFAQCNCSKISTPFQIPIFTTNSNLVGRQNINNSSSFNTNINTLSNKSTIDNKNTRRLFQSFSHPDTDFVFTEKNIRFSNQNLMSDNSILISNSEEIALKQKKRLSSPNIRHFSIQNGPEYVNASKNEIKIQDNSNTFEQFDNENDLTDAAQKFFEESGILGPITSPTVIRKSSKILQNPKIIEKIRKNSNLLRSNGHRISLSYNIPSSELDKSIMDYSPVLKPLLSPKSLSKPILKLADKNKTPQDSNGNTLEKYNSADMKSLQMENESLRTLLKCKENEICKLKREIHKIKSVLQQTTNHIAITKDELLSPIKDIPSPFPSCEMNKLEICEKDQGSNSDVCSSSSINKPKIHLMPVLKKQGVSGESCDSSVQLSNMNEIQKFNKDFSSKQLIKDAIMDNDFLKNIDSSQVRELVESMHSIQVSKGEYVIREGEVGAHLYVSAEGQFEVVKNGVVLGVMGTGKAFGELAILYNCTRTASVRAISDARLWVLDRRVFQMIMMKTGMQRIKENVNFLKSVPLLKNLSDDVLAKISDVLEVEFYTAGTYIIRQGTSGDSFFIICQGSVKVTQKINDEEKEIRVLGRGDYFGEQALINEDKRTANIIALNPGVECLTLDRDSFTHLIGDLCELKEKNYGDENRVLSIKYSEKVNDSLDQNLQQEFSDLKLSDLEVVATLGIGGFGRVELVKTFYKNKTETFALKCLKKKHIIDTRQEEHVFSERTIMLTCKSPFICRCYRTFRDKKYVYLLLESCIGGEVWTILRDKGKFQENMAQFIIGCVLEAFEYLHSRGIIYRDLKPENLMLDNRGYIKLVDFGFAKYIGKCSKTWTFCGTPEYVAPEIILNRGHDRAVDYWALGILIHELLNGTPPFSANDPMKTYNYILKGIDMIDFPKHMSRAAVMLIKKLCRDVPAERLGYQKGGIQDIKKHKWFQGFDWDGLQSQTLKPPFLRPVSSEMDLSYFDKFPSDCDVPPDETSDWDINF